jgi:hypothetical protein
MLVKVDALGVDRPRRPLLPEAHPVPPLALADGTARHTRTAHGAVPAGARVVVSASAPSLFEYMRGLTNGRRYGVVFSMFSL